MTFLADTSMIVRLRRGQDVEACWVDAVRAGLVGVCSAVEAELVRAASTKADRDALQSVLLDDTWFYPGHGVPRHHRRTP